MAKITAPVAHFTGISAVIAFLDGVATTDDEAAINYFTQAGYVVDGEVSEDAVTGDMKPVSKLNKTELGLLAAQKGIAVPASATKSDIVDLLDAKDAADPGSQPAPSEGAAVTNVVPGTGPETGAADGAAFGTTPAASDAQNEDAQGEVVA